MSPRADFQIGDFIVYFYSESAQVGLQFEEALEVAVASLTTFCKYEIKYQDIRTFRIAPFKIAMHYRVDEQNQLIRIEGVYHEHSIRRA
jgi:hypothetical protein